MTFDRCLILALLLILVLILFRPQPPVRLEMTDIPASPNYLKQPVSTSANVGDILSVIHNRKSVRNYTSDPVSTDELHTLVRAGFAAPTGANRQPWEFVIVTEREKLDAISSVLVWGQMLTKAPAAIVVCSNTGTLEDDLAVRQSLLDCAAACENILLAAEGTGLGAVWCAVYPYDGHTVGVRRILELPSEVIPVAVIAVGRPTGVERPKDKYKPEKMHFQRWGSPFPR